MSGITIALSKGRIFEETLPLLAAAGIVTPNAPRSQIADQYRVIKRPLIANAMGKGAAPVKRGNLIMVTSAVSGEGKSFSAINLAMSIARQTPGNTILADLDFRRPEVANYLGVGANADIHAVLKGQTPLDEVLFSLDVSGPRLLFLPARSPIAHPAETLTSPEARNLVGTLRSLAQQSFVIFDMPPMLFADDVIAFMPQIDAVLLVIAAGAICAGILYYCRSDKRKLERENEALRVKHQWEKAYLSTPHGQPVRLSDAG